MAEAAIDFPWTPAGRQPEPPSRSRTTWPSLSSWTRAAHALRARPDSRRVRADARALWMAFPVEAIDAAPASVCRDFLFLTINERASGRAPWGRPPDRARPGSTWRSARLRALDRLRALEARASRATAPETDRAAVMRDAHKRFADGKRLSLGWTFSQCLKTAWAAARLRACPNSGARH